jgi:hypothetical protein
MKMDVCLSYQSKLGPNASRAVSDLDYLYTIEIIVTGYRGEFEEDEPQGTEMDDNKLRELVDDLFGKHDPRKKNRPESHVRSVETLVGKDLHKRMKDMTEYDKYAHVQDFAGAKYHANLTVAQFAAIRVNAYKQLEAEGMEKKVLLQYEPSALKLSDTLFDGLKELTRPRAYQLYTDTWREKMQMNCPLQRVNESYGRWQDQFTEITNGWVDAENSPEGPEHKRKHPILWGKPGMGKTSFVRNVVFKGLHRSVSTQLCK